MEEEVESLFRRQRTHNTDAKDLSGERAEPTRDLDSMFIQQLLADSGVVDAFRYARGVERRQTMTLGDVHAQPHRFGATDERRVTGGMPGETLLDAFLLNCSQRFA